jgi:YD repeat-containing protein
MATGITPVSGSSDDAVNEKTQVSHAEEHTMRRTGILYILVLLLIPITLSSRVEGSDGSILEESFHWVTDLNVPSGAITVHIQRHFVTGEVTRGVLGTRWRMNWESHLSIKGDVVQLEEWTGTTSFTRAGNETSYANAAGERIVLGSDGRAVYSLIDGGSETFSAKGQLTERKDRHGNLINLSYDQRDRLSRVQGPGGAFLKFNVDGLGRVILVEASTGATIRYGYEKDDLAEVEVNGGPPIRYRYDTVGYLVRIDDPQKGALDIT